MVETFAVLFGKMLIRAAFGALIGAVFLRAAAQWVAKEDVPYGKAYGLYFLNHLIIGSIVLVGGFCLGLYAGVTGTEINTGLATAVLVPLALVLGLPAAAGVIRSGLSIPFGRAMLVTIVMYALALAVFGAIAVAALFLLD